MLILGLKELPLTIRSCAVVVARGPRGEDVLCKQPAAFLYYSLVPLRIKGTDQTYSARAKERVVLDECMDHTRETFIRMEPAFRTGEVRMRCLLQTKYTIHCSACQSVFRFEPLKPTTVKMQGHFCPNCGAGPDGGVLRTMDPQLDYWELIASEIGIADNASLAQEVHSMWLRDKQSTTNFVEYIQAIQREIDEAS